MRHPPSVWDHPDNADYPLAELREAYATHLAGRGSDPVSPGTVVNYQKALVCFEASLALVDLNTKPPRLGDGPILASLTPSNVERWLVDMRERRLGHGYAEETISSYLSILKTFSNKYIFRQLEMTRRDLLERVDRYRPPLRMEDGFTDKELQQILSCTEGSERYTDVRDRALLTFYAASGLRFAEVLRIQCDDVDRYSGRARTVGKGRYGGKERRVRISERALRPLRVYLRVRRAADGVGELFTTDEGLPISYDGGQSIMRRMKLKAGVDNLHAHRFRHTWAQTAFKKGADARLVQDQMGWETDQMVKRYAGFIRSEVATESMPEFAPI
jgi:integrase/recombinase XerC